MRVDFTHYKYHNNKLSPLFTFYDQSTHIYEQAIYVVASNSSHFNEQFRILLGFLFQRVVLSILSKMFLLFFSLDPLVNTKHQISNEVFFSYCPILKRPGYVFYFNFKMGNTNKL